METDTAIETDAATSGGIAIWWLDQRSYELAEALGVYKEDWPAYILREFRLRTGRPGNGALWVADEFGDLGGFGWKAGEPVSDAIGKGYGGIVIRRADIGHVACWPGFVSDEYLHPIRLDMFSIA